MRPARPFDAGDARLRAAGRAAFPDFAVRAVARTESTQELALAAARAGASGGWCVVADEQTRGRGRQGRPWAAPPRAALLTSIVLDGGRPGGWPGGWPALAAGVAVAEAIEDAAPSTRGLAVLKWPNDVLLRSRATGAPRLGKVAGILVEGRAAGRPLVLGIGVNVRVDTFPEGAAGVSLHTACAPDPPPSREHLLAAIIEHLAAWWPRLSEPGGPAAVAAAWTARAAGLGAPVSAETPSGLIVGTAIGLDADGALLVSTTGGEVRLVAGDVHLGPVVTAAESDDGRRAPRKAEPA